MDICILIDLRLACKETISLNKEHIAARLQKYNAYNRNFNLIMKSFQSNFI